VLLKLGGTSGLQQQKYRCLRRHLQELNVFLEEVIDQLRDWFAGLLGNALKSFAGVTVQVYW